jgi:hypothetical protein
MSRLQIPNPCHESWDAMTPNHQGRHCASCDKTVVDVTAMAPAAARAYLGQEVPARIKRGERICVRTHGDRSGRLLRPGVTRRLLTNGLAAVLAMAMADYAGGAGLAAAEGGTEPQTTEPVEPLKGEVMPAIAGDICLPEPAVAPVSDTASGLTISASNPTCTVTATRQDQTVAWSVTLPAQKVGGVIDRLAIDGATVVVSCGNGANGKPVVVRLDLASGAGAPHQ